MELRWLDPTMSPHRWSRLAFAAALVTGAVLAFIPAVSTSSCSASSDGPMICSTVKESLLAQEGGGILFVLAAPAIIALVPVLLPWRPVAMAAAGVLTAATLISIASVGMFLLPTVAMAWFAVTASGERATPAVQGAGGSSPPGS